MRVPDGSRTAAAVIATAARRAMSAPFIARHMIRKADRAFDDFAGGTADKALLNAVLGIG